MSWRSARFHLSSLCLAPAAAAWLSGAAAAAAPTVVKADAKALKNGDPVLEAALRWLRG